MGKSLIISSGLDTTVANTTEYCAIGGSLVLGTPEASFQVPWREAGTISNLTALVTANGVNAVCSIRLRKNGANGNSIANTVANTPGLIQDNTNTDTIAAGDLLCFMISHGAATGTLSISYISFVFTPTNSSITHTKLVVGFASSANVSVVYYDTLTGAQQNSNTTIANSQIRIPVAGSFKHFSLYGSGGGRAVTTRFTKNSTDDLVTRCTLASGVNGLNEDTSSSVSVAANDTVGQLHVYGGSGTTRTVNHIGVSFEHSGNYFLFVLAHAPGIAFNSALTRYFPISGQWISSSSFTSEADCKVRCSIPFIASKLSIRMPTNTLNSGNFTVTVRKNGSDTALQVLIPNGATDTGVFEDNSNVVNFEVGDDIDYKIDSNGTSGTATPVSISLLAEYNPVVTGVSDYKDIIRQRPQTLITNSI